MRIKFTKLLSVRGAQSIFLSFVATASLSGFYPQHASSADGGLQIEVLSHTGETEVNLEYLDEESLRSHYRCKSKYVTPV